MFKKAKFLKQEKSFIGEELLYMGAGLKPGEGAQNGQ